MALPLTYNLRSIAVRKISSFMTASGIALVIAVFIMVLALAQGFQQALVETGLPENLLIMRSGANSEVQSSIPREAVNIIKSFPEIARDVHGQPLLSPELLVLININKRADNQPSNVRVRGVSPEEVFAIRSNVKITEGRMFRSGLSEVIVGKLLSERFQNCRLGEKLKFARREWTVVGLFDSGGTGYESEIWGDNEQFLPAFQRQTFQSVTVKLNNSDDYITVMERIEGDPRLNLNGKPEKDYYSEQSIKVSRFIRILGTFIAAIMAVGAVFGALNTMYAAVAHRTREIGILLAIGFSPRSVLLSFLIESFILSLIGGVMGCIISLPIHGVSTGTTNWQSFSEVVFNFRITPELLIIGVILAAVIGIIGGILPAHLAARQVIATALRHI